MTKDAGSTQIIQFPVPAPGNCVVAPALPAASWLLADIATAFRRHLSLPDGAADAIALWILFAHSFDAWQTSPRLFFSSPTPQCGKSTALAMIGALTPRARLAANMTAPVVFRLIEQERPCLLVDEADTFLSGKGDLRGILNSGHTPAGAHVWRCDRAEWRLEANWCCRRVGGLDVLTCCRAAGGAGAARYGMSARRVRVNENWAGIPTR